MQIDASHLEGEPAVPAHRGPLEAGRVALGEEEAERERVAELEMLELTGRCESGEDVAPFDGTLEASPWRSGRHEHMFA